MGRQVLPRLQQLRRSLLQRRDRELHFWWTRRVCSNHGKLPCSFLLLTLHSLSLLLPFLPSSLLSSSLLSLSLSPHRHTSHTQGTLPSVKKGDTFAVFVGGPTKGFSRWHQKWKMEEEIFQIIFWTSIRFVWCVNDGRWTAICFETV